MARAVRRLAILTLAAAVFLPACTFDPEKRKQQYFESAEGYFHDRKYDEAIVEYRNALQQDPKFTEARFKLAETYAAKNDLRHAYPEYIRASDLNPEDLRIQAKAGHMLLLGRRFEDARLRARRILQKEPNNLEGLILLGNALAGLGDLPNAVEIAERAVTVDPEREGTFVNLGTLQLARGNEKEAEDAFTAAVQLNPKSVSAHLALGNFFQATERLDLAEASLTQAIALVPKDVRANRAIAAFYVRTGRAAQAEPYLRGIAQQLNDPSAWIDLADFLAWQQRNNDAVTILETLAADPKQYARARRRMAAIVHAAGRKDEAHAILADILKRNANDGDTQALRARLLLRDRRSDEAVDAARAAVVSNNRSADAHLILGRVLLARGDHEQGRRALMESAGLDPRLLEPRLTLANLHLAVREIDPAVEVATAAVDAHPDNLDARLLLIRALLVRPEDHAKARTHAEAAVRDFPRAAAARASLGTYYLTTRDKAAARREFEAALLLDAGYTDALADLMALDAEAGRHADARSRVQAHLTLRPHDPRVLLLSAKLAMTERQLAEAERLLRKTAGMPGAPPETFTLLGRLFIAQGRLTDATNEFQSLLKSDSQAIVAHLMLGLLLHARGDLRAAITHYEKAIAIDPRVGAPAANNLAWIYAENGQNLDRALELALLARTHLPSDAEPLDTLGWVYYKKEMTSLAETFIRQAVDLEPQNPQYHYHLGVLYAQRGDDANARKSLERTLALKPGKQVAQDAQKILKSLVY